MLHDNYHKVSEDNQQEEEQEEQEEERLYYSDTSFPLKPTFTLVFLHKAHYTHLSI